GGLLIGSSLLLCTNIHYSQLSVAALHLDVRQLVDALPQQVSDFYVPMATAALTLVYGWLLPWLYASPDEKRRAYFLSISMVANLAILGFFKYCDFFLTSLETLLATLGFGYLAGQTLGIILPAGISFYTFQAMSYTIDIYRGETEPTDNFRDFALFVCFF